MKKYGNIISRREGVHMWTTILANRRKTSESDKKISRMVWFVIKVSAFVAVLFIVWILSHF